MKVCHKISNYEAFQQYQDNLTLYFFSYPLDAIVGFLEATPLSTGNKYLDTCGMLLIIIPLASMSDFSMISKVSALGTFLIFFVFALIGIYGIYENGYEGFTKIHEQRIWPDHVSGLSSWYGVVACK